MLSLALAIFALPALAAAEPPHLPALGALAGQGPGFESEPNDRPGCANALGAMPAVRPLTVWGEIAHPLDQDVFRVDVLEPTVLDLRVVTGAALTPLSSVGGTGPTDPVYSDSFIPVLTILGPDGRVILTHVSSAPNLLLMEFPVPLYGASFYASLMAWPGSFGPYGLQVCVH